MNKLLKYTNFLCPFNQPLKTIHVPGKPLIYESSPSFILPEKLDYEKPFVKLKKPKRMIRMVPKSKGGINLPPFTKLSSWFKSLNNHSSPMKTFIYRAIVLILLCLYFMLVFAQGFLIADLRLQIADLILSPGFSHNLQSAIANLQLPPL